jgi:putative transposase
MSEAEIAITTLCQENKYRYGHRKITKLLQKIYSIKLHRNTVCISQLKFEPLRNNN